jgi:TolA-binding protein
MPCLVLAALAFAAPALAATPADQQYEFAQKLARTGDARFAVLEYRRFVHLFPRDRRVPEARFAIARAYLQGTGDVAAARRELDLVAREHQGTQAAQRARQLMALIEAGKEDDYAPVRLFFGAVGAREREDHEAALAKLDELVKRYPRAALVPEALFMRAQALQALGRLDDAIAAYAEVLARAPRSPLAPRALLGQAVAAEARDGAQPHVAVLYRQVLARHPRTPQAAEARERLAALQANLDTIPRRFRRADVLAFKVLRQGYLDRRDRYEVHIELPAPATDDQVKATLEDALVRYAGQRQDRAHQVRVEAYVPNDRDRVGRVTWAQNRRPDYDVDVEAPADNDVWIDILKEVLK